LFVYINSLFANVKQVVSIAELFFILYLRLEGVDINFTCHC